MRAPSPRGLIPTVAIAAALLTAAPVRAQTYTVTTNSSPDLGIIVPDANSTTTFSFASSTGNVTQSGNAVRRMGTTTRAQVTIACSAPSGNACADPIAVKIGSIGAPTGKAGALANFNVTLASAKSLSAVTGTNPITFTITPTNKNSDVSFYVGADFPIGASSSAGTFGAAQSQFYVYAAHSPTTPTTGTTVTATATTYRGISISGASMAFGTISKPGSGTTTVTLGAGSDTVALTGGTTSTASGTAQRASYTVSGEGGMAITVTVDPTITMNRTGGGGSFAITTNHSTLPTTIPGSAGASGTTATFYVGGAFNITTSTAAGDYTGSFNVTASYN